MTTDDTAERLEPSTTDTNARVDDDTLAALAKALAHPARVRILRILARQETCITGDVVAELDLAQSTVSEHLRILRETGLVQGEIEGPRTHYCINPSALATLGNGITDLTATTR